MITRQLTLFDDLILPPRCDKDEAACFMGKLRERGIVVGTDEVGRGALAGPVVGAAVCLTPEQESELLRLKLRDSKRITPNGREKLFSAMNDIGVIWRVCMESPKIIDNVNVLQASLCAMGMAVSRLVRDLGVSPACVIVDGTDRIPGLEFPQWVLIKADDIIPSVSAASVVAKVIRDRLMVKLSEKYPEYGFAKNKGYPTRMHMEAVRDIGMSDIHRRTFCRKIVQEGEKINAVNKR